MSIHENLRSKTIMTLGYLMLIFSVIFFLSKIFNKDDLVFIKDLMGVAGTFFAPLVALYIFQEWIVQKRLEALSINSKEKISEIPAISSEFVSFHTLSNDLINRKNIYKKNPNPLLLQQMQELSTSLYKHPFVAISMNFDNSFQEIKDGLPQSDLKIYEALSENMKTYQNLIFKEKILDLNTEKTDADINKLEILYKETGVNLSNFYKKLTAYKNFSYKLSMW